MINRRFVPPSQRRALYVAVPGRPDLKRFVGFEGDPGTRGGLGALGTADRHSSVPMPDGSPGTAFQNDYDERFIWGTPGSGTSPQVTSPIDPSTPVPPVAEPQAFDPGISIPFGVSIIKWQNPTTMQSVPILTSSPSNTPILSLNLQRNSLIIQNNSTATTPDVAPTFYIGFNAQPQQGLSLAIVPGAGLLFDIITPRDAVYVLIAGGAGASQVVQGVIVQGTYAPLDIRTTAKRASAFMPFGT